MTTPSPVLSSVVQVSHSKQSVGSPVWAQPPPAGAPHSRQRSCLIPLQREDRGQLSPVRVYLQPSGRRDLMGPGSHAATIGTGRVETAFPPPADSPLAAGARGRSPAFSRGEPDVYHEGEHTPKSRGKQGPRRVRRVLASR